MSFEVAKETVLFFPVVKTGSVSWSRSPWEGSVSVLSAQRCPSDKVSPSG